MLGEFGGILKVITSTMFFFYAFYNLWRMGSYLEGVMLAPSRKEAKEVKKLLGFDKKYKKRNNFQIDFSKVEPAGKNKKEEKEADPQKVLKSLLSTRFDVDKLLSKLNTIELIEKLLFFNEDQKKLIPLVLFNLTQQQLSQQNNQSKNQSKGTNENIMNNTNYNHLNHTNYHHQHLDMEQKQDQGALNRQSLSYDQIYRSLLNSESGDPLKTSMKQLMLNNLEKTFNQSRVSINPKSGGFKGQDVNSEILKLNAARNDVGLKFFGEKLSKAVEVAEETLKKAKIGISLKQVSSTAETPNTSNSSSRQLQRVNSASRIRRNSSSALGRRLIIKSKFRPVNQSPKQKGQ